MQSMDRGVLAAVARTAWIEGRTIPIEYRWRKDVASNLPRSAAEFVG